MSSLHNWSKIASIADTGCEGAFLHGRNEPVHQGQGP